jgi:transcriptional regulator with XRE-family HTH domain
MRIGHNILRHRNQLGWSQEALAAKVGKKQSDISRIEASQRDITLDELEEFAEALQTTPWELMGDSKMNVKVESQQGGQNAYNLTNHHAVPEALINAMQSQINELSEEARFYRGVLQQMLEQSREFTNNTGQVLEYIKMWIESQRKP